jgi:hypothetical protein
VAKPAVTMLRKVQRGDVDAPGRLIKAIHREEETGHPLKMMIGDLGIPKASLNESSFDWPVRHNTVIKHAAHFHTPSDHEANALCHPYKTWN